jgi:hypothetical protein
VNGAARYRGITIEPVPDAPWLVGYGWRHAGILHYAVIRACPDYSSDELRTACWNTLVASVMGECDLCGAVAPIPAELKTAPAGIRGWGGQDPLTHRDGCPCSGECLDALDQRDSPDGQGAPMDFSEESRHALVVFVNAVMERYAPA